MLDTEIRVAMRSGLTEGTPLMSISPSPRVSESCFCVPFLMMLLTSLIGSTAVFLAPGDELVTVIYPIVEKVCAYYSAGTPPACEELSGASLIIQTEKSVNGT